MNPTPNWSTLQAPSRTTKRVALLLGLLILLHVAWCWLTDSALHPVILGPLFVGFITGLLFPRSSLLTSLCTITVILVAGLIALGASIMYLLLMLPLLLPLLWLGTFLGCVSMRHLRTRHG